MVEAVIIDAVRVAAVTTAAAKAVATLVAVAVAAKEAAAPILECECVRSERVGGQCIAEDPLHSESSTAVPKYVGKGCRPGHCTPSSTNCATGA